MGGLFFCVFLGSVLGGVGVIKFKLSQYRDSWWTFVNEVMNFGLLRNEEMLVSEEGIRSVKLMSWSVSQSAS